MAWITCCPSCQTTFRVLPEQLTQAQAWLRCSQCERVFDSTGLVVNWQQSLEPLSTKTPEGQSAQQTSLDDMPPTKATGLWSAALLLLGAMPMLVLFQQRQAVVTTWPGIWSTVNRVCAVVRCEVPAPMRAQDVVIDTSSFVPLNEGYALTAVLRNTATWSVRSPVLELTLLDVQEQPVLRRVLTLQELQLAPTLQPEQSVQVRLEFSIDARLTPVTGYRLRSVEP